MQSLGSRQTTTISVIMLRMVYLKISQNGDVHFVALMNTLEIAGSVNEQKVISDCIQISQSGWGLLFLWAHLYIKDYKINTNQRSCKTENCIIFFPYLSCWIFFCKADKSWIWNSLGNLKFTIGFLVLQN